MSGDKLSDDMAVEDLFGPSQSELEEDLQDFGTPVTKSLGLTPGSAADTSNLITLVPGAIKIDYTDSKDSSDLKLQATVENMSQKTIDLEHIYLDLHDEEGRLLDVSEGWVSTKFVKQQDLVTEIQVGPGVLKKVRSITLWARYRFDFQSLLASGECLPIEPRGGDESYREYWPVTLKAATPSTGMPSFDVAVTGYYGASYRAMCDWLVDVTENTPTQDHNRELVVALRDENGAIIKKETQSFYLPGVGINFTAKVHFYDIERRKLRAVRRVDFGIKGTCTRREKIGVFKVGGA